MFFTIKKTELTKKECLVLALAQWCVKNPFGEDERNDIFFGQMDIHTVPIKKLKCIAPVYQNDYSVKKKDLSCFSLTLCYSPLGSQLPLDGDDDSLFFIRRCETIEIILSDDQSEKLRLYAIETRNALSENSLSYYSYGELMSIGNTSYERWTQHIEKMLSYFNEIRRLSAQ